MRKILLLLSALVPLMLCAQMHKERRVYYLDASYSMHKPNNIWEPVKKDLINAIKSVEDETTELVVFPFSDASHDHTPVSAMATTAGKQKLIDFIDGYEYHDRTCMTVHNLPMTDFFNNRTKDDRLTYMFFMTDGENEKEVEEFNSKLKAWSDRYGNRNVYGFFVMLHESAHNPEVEKIVDSQKHLWLVNTANVNIHLTRAEGKAVFNIRSEKYVDVPVYGPIQGYNIEASIDDPHYEITKSELSEGRLRVYIQGKVGNGMIPEDKDIALHLKVKKSPDNFSFWVTDLVRLKCLNKKERTLKISVE